MMMRWDLGKEVGRSRWGSSCHWRLEGGRLSGRFAAPTGCAGRGYWVEVGEGWPLRAAWCMDSAAACEACYCLLFWATHASRIDRRLGSLMPASCSTLRCKIRRYSYLVTRKWNSATIEHLTDIFTNGIRGLGFADEAISNIKLLISFKSTATFARAVAANYVQHSSIRMRMSQSSLHLRKFISSQDATYYLSASFFDSHR